MVDADRMQAEAEQAEIQGQMARTKLLMALASHDALAARWSAGPERRRDQRQAMTDTEDGHFRHRIGVAGPLTST